MQLASAWSRELCLREQRLRLFLSRLERQFSSIVPCLRAIFQADIIAFLTGFAVQNDLEAGVIIQQAGIPSTRGSVVVKNSEIAACPWSCHRIAARQRWPDHRTPLS